MASVTSWEAGARFPLRNDASSTDWEAGELPAGMPLASAKLLLKALTAASRVLPVIPNCVSELLKEFVVVRASACWPACKAVGDAPLLSSVANRSAACGSVLMLMLYDDISGLLVTRAPPAHRRSSVSLAGHSCVGMRRILV